MDTFDNMQSGGGDRSQALEAQLPGCGGETSWQGQAGGGVRVCCAARMLCSLSA
jgi:hypothetical protein